MADKKLRFALFGNEYQARKSASIQKVLDVLGEQGAEIYMDRPFYEFLTQSLGLKVRVAGLFDDYNFDVDFCISMGGDGTFLKTASRVGAKCIPIVGINTGRLGFLADVGPTEIEEALDLLFAGTYDVEKQTIIKIEADGEPIEGNPYALNDIALLKRDMASMISIRTCINGDYLVTYQADGLIVTTPTGSTAYSLSNGGPIMVPQTGTLCLTAVAPHSLNIRPIVIPDDCEITLEVESRSHNFLAAIDGRSEKLLEGTRVTIRKAPFSAHVVKRKGQRYFSTLREKMMWGMDGRRQFDIKSF
ncbi:MAG: NAD kinase [Prevotella sp.]|nr:NAD kinase [Prevotella sp.]MDD7045766.1 NAD kinase [Prevotella sp.]MDY5547433.1 NAD kinase [Prevotella sp.]